MSDESNTIDSAETPDGRQDVSAPTGGGQMDFDSQIGPKSKSVNRGNIILAVMFAAGLGTLYLLGSKDAPAQASASQQAAEQQVEIALARLAARPAADNAEANKAGILSTLHYKISDRQVPSAKLTGNPFMFLPPGTNPTVSMGGFSKSSAADRARGRQVTSMMEAAEGLRLQCLLCGGKEPLALISDKLVRVGQSVEGWSVAKIGARSVLLKWNGREHLLKLPKPSSAQGG